MLHWGGVLGLGSTIQGQHRRVSPNHINMMVPMLDLSGGATLTKSVTVTSPNSWLDTRYSGPKRDGAANYG